MFLRSTGDFRFFTKVGTLNTSREVGMTAQKYYLARVMVWAQTLDQARQSGVATWIKQAQEQYNIAVQDAEQAGFPVQ